MFSSVKLGFSHTTGDRVFITPGDYPLVSCEVYQSMLKDKSDIVIPIYNNLTGHPVLINKVAIFYIFCVFHKYFAKTFLSTADTESSST
mgnify:CR=1 FL=1